ncbi:MAG: patatin-like phospholipase family protein [Verrucomicrobiota bacterium]
MSPAVPKLALVLGGGGARAAYQAGFLHQLAREFPELNFPILTGVSAGAINAAFLANAHDPFPRATDQLESLWRGITVEQVFRSDFPALLKNMLHWALRLTTGGTRVAQPTRGLVDTAPLKHFLKHGYRTDSGLLHGIEANLQSGRLSALGITTTNYRTGQSVTWVQGDNLATWERAGRSSRHCVISVDHILASCALPLFFPAIELGSDWHGDGGVRLTAPLSPALHLRADRMLAISTLHRPAAPLPNGTATHGYPPPATVLGVVLDAVFLDMLDHDASTLERINRLVRASPSPAEPDLRPVELLMIRPSEDLGRIANECEPELPLAFRFATRGLGTREAPRADLLATLLFQPRYINRLLALGARDAAARRDEVAAFLQIK